MIRILTACVVLAFVTGCQPQQISLKSDLTIGSTFPAVEGVDLDGTPILMSDYKGKVVLVDFFGDW